MVTNHSLPWRVVGDAHMEGKSNPSLFFLKESDAAEYSDSSFPHCLILSAAPAAPVSAQLLLVKLMAPFNSAACGSTTLTVGSSGTCRFLSSLFVLRVN